jgi:hypothetical protein
MKIDELPLPALAFNTLFPRDLRVVGPEVDEFLKQHWH